MLLATDLQTSLRAFLLTLGADTNEQDAPIAKSTAPALAAVADGYTRTDGGSFVADGFARGMELTTAGFGTNPKRQIINVSAAKIKVAGVVPAEASAGGRALTVSLPSARAWEDVEFTPVQGVPFIEEQFVEGARFNTGTGPGADQEIRPLAVYFVNVPSNSGLAARMYADGLIRLFAPGAFIPLVRQTTPADYMRVRDGIGPTGGQLQPSERFAGFSSIPVSVNLVARTLNLI